MKRGSKCGWGEVDEIGWGAPGVDCSVCKCAFLSRNTPFVRLGLAVVRKCERLI